MDNISNWWPGFTEEEYSKYWQKEFGFSTRDKELIAKYSAIRQKHYSDPDQKEKNPLKNRNGFFSTNGSISADPYAEAFYSSNELEEAFEKLKKTLNKDELSLVIEFYQHFKPKYEKLIANDKVSFKKSIELAQETFSLNGVEHYFEKVAQFYNVKGDVTYRVLFTWWPPISRTNATPTGTYLIMRNNPKLHKNRNDSDIVAHEIIHTFSARQTLEQKQSLTRNFLSKCPVADNLKKLVILEEPLAVIFGQLLFSERFKPKEFSLTENLYNNPWINTFSRTVFFPLKTRFEKGEKITGGAVDDAATLCLDLYRAAPMVNGSF